MSLLTLILKDRRGREETEIDLSVGPVLIITWTFAETHTIGMFKDKKAIFLKNPSPQNHGRYLLKPVKIVRGVSKNYVVLRCAGPEKGFDINMDRFYVVDLQFFYYFFYPGDMPEVFLDKMNIFSTPRGKLKTYAPGPGEEIEHIKSFKINTVIKYVEKALPGKVGGWSCTETGRRSDPSSLVFSANYSQLNELKRLRYLCNSVSLNT